MFQYHANHIHNEIVKTFRAVILKYAERIREMHYLDMYLPTPLMKEGESNQAAWDFCGKEWSEYEICNATKDRLWTSMQDGI